MVDLVLLHGPPASGKLTIAKALSALVDARVFHNHLTLDVAKSMLDFGKPEFWDLVHDLRLLSFQSYFKNGIDPLIATWCYEEPEDYEYFLKIKSIAADRSGRVLPVYLNCDIMNLENRVTNDHRRKMEKLCNVEQLRKIMSTKNYAAIPDKMCIEINSAANTAEFNAKAIVKSFSL